MLGVVGLALIWGSSFLFIKIAGRGLTPLTVSAGRVVLGLVFLAVVTLVTRRRLPRDRTWYRHATVVGVTFSALPFTLQTWAIRRIDSTLASVLNATTPLWAAALGLLLFNERVRRSQFVGLVIGFVGVAVAVGLFSHGIERAPATAVAAMLTSTASYGFGYHYIRRHVSGADPIVSAVSQNLMATAIVLPMAIGSSVVDGFHPTPTRLLALASLGFLGTGLAYILNFHNIATLGAAKASTATFLVPIMSITLGVLFLDEAFRWRHVVGAAIIVAGVLLVQERLVAFVRASPLVRSG